MAASATAALAQATAERTRSLKRAACVSGIATRTTAFASPAGAVTAT